MAARCWCQLHGTAKTQWFQDVNNEFLLFHVKQDKRVWPQVEIASLLCADWIFFFFFFGLLFIPMQWLSKHFFIFFPKQTGANWICWLGVCYVGEHELDDALVGGAERSPWCSSPCRCTLRGPVSLLNDAGHHRTVLFNLKSAGFKALCWQ